MKILPACRWLLLASLAPLTPLSPFAPQAGAQEAWPHCLHFGEQEVLHGRMESFSAQEGLVWRHRDGAADFVIRPETLDTVALGVGSPKPDPDADVRVQFNNGDALAGKMVSFNPETVVLETACAGRVSVDAKKVRRLIFEKNGGIVWDGFGPFAQWKDPAPTRGQFKIADGKMTVSGYKWVSRELPFGPSFQLSLTAMSRHNDQIQWMFCTQEKDQQQLTEGYTLTLSGAQGQIHFYKQSKGNYEPLGIFPCALARQGPVDIQVDADGEAKTLTVWINGQQVGVAKDAKGLLKGKGIRLGSNHESTTFSRLVLTRGAPYAVNLHDLPPNDVLRFANQDVAHGQLRLIDRGQAQVVTQAGEFSVPVARLAKVDFSSQYQEVPQSQDSDARVFFDTYNSLSLRLQRIQNGQLTGTSPTLGPCTLDMKGLQKIVFNLKAPWRQERERQEEQARKKYEEKPAPPEAGNGLFLFPGGGFFPGIFLPRRNGLRLRDAH